MELEDNKPVVCENREHGQQSTESTDHRSCTKVKEGRKALMAWPTYR